VLKKGVPGKKSIQDHYYQHSQFESGTKDAVWAKKANLERILFSWSRINKKHRQCTHGAAESQHLL